MATLAEQKTDVTRSSQTVGAPPQALLDAYNQGRLDPEQRKRVEDRFNLAPTGVKPPLVPMAWAHAYSADIITDAQRDRIDALVAAGAVAMPSQTAIDNYAMTPKGVDPVGSTAPVVNRGTFDRTREMGGDMMGAAGAYAAGATGLGPSVTAQAIPEDWPELARYIIGGGADLGMAALTGTAALAQGAAGLVGDVADMAGMPPASADRLSYDLAAMPDAFAGSPNAFVRPGANLPRVAPQARPVARPAAVAGDAARVDPAAAAAMADPAQVGRLVADASKSTKPNAAQRRLAGAMDIDPEAQAAADTLGFDLPPDVLSRNEQIKAAAGLTRSAAGQAPEAAWRNTIAAASDRAIEVMKDIQSTNLSEVSERVKDSLRNTRTSLDAEAKPIFDSVRDRVGPRTLIEPNNMVRTVNQIVGDLGGEAGMSTAERSLFNLVTSDQPITYERLSREMRDVGKAIGKQDGPYKDVDSAYLKRVYGAMAEDRLANVERIAGPEVRADLETANALHEQKKDLEKVIVSAFGKDGEGSIATKLVTAVNQGAKKGDISGLNRILNVIPEDLRGEALATAIGHVATSTGSTATPFNFAAYSSLYKGMRDNPAVYSRVIGTLGPEADGILRGLYVVSDRVTKAGPIGRFVRRITLSENIVRISMFF